jgi:pimeloyl-ACP methyl ester carboxylesterase
VSETGTGRPFLLLHGGAGPVSVAGFGELLGRGARVLVPTHPGFGGTPRPEALKSVPGLAALYVALLDQLDLHDVTVVGNSIGGWIAAEIALLASPRVSSVVLLDAAGIVVEGHPAADPFAIPLPELIQRSYYEPEKFKVDPSTLSDAQRAAIGANRAALALYGGQAAAGDSTLRARLAKVTVPTLVAWGEADRVVDLEYGRAYAAAIPNAEFKLLPKAGHLPQIETPEQTLRVVQDFSAAHQA